MGETGDADKEAAPLMQATDQLQKATQLHKSWGQEMYWRKLTKLSLHQMLQAFRKSRTFSQLEAWARSDFGSIASFP